MEEIERMLDENDNFNLDDIQILLDELVYNHDMIEEYDKDLKQCKEDRITYAKIHNEYNRKLPEQSILIRQTKDIINKLDEKQKRLGGRISKYDVEKRISFQTQLDDLEKEYQELRNNRNEAKKGFEETEEKYNQLLDDKKGETSKQQFKDYANKLENICKYCMTKMKEMDNNLEKASQQIEKATTIEEKLEAALSFKEAVDYKNKNYYNYEKIMNFISNSEEYQSTISEHLIDDLKEKLEKTEITKEEPTNEEPTNEGPTNEGPTNDGPTNEGPTSEEIITDERFMIEKNDDFEDNKENEVKETQSNDGPEEPINEEFINEEPIEFSPIYWQMQYPKIDEVKPYVKDMSSDPMTLEQLANEGPIFKDEERIDQNYDFMSYQNAQNLNLTNEKELTPKEESVQEKTGIFQKIKDKINKEKEEMDNVIANIDYAPEGLINKANYKLHKFLLQPEKFEEWCENQEIKQARTI